MISHDSWTSSARCRGHVQARPSLRNTAISGPWAERSPTSRCVVLARHASCSCPRSTLHVTLEVEYECDPLLTKLCVRPPGCMPRPLARVRIERPDSPTSCWGYTNCKCRRHPNGSRQADRPSGIETIENSDTPQILLTTPSPNSTSSSGAPVQGTTSLPLALAEQAIARRPLETLDYRRCPGIAVGTEILVVEDCFFARGLRQFRVVPVCIGCCANDNDNDEQPELTLVRPSSV